MFLFYFYGWYCVGLKFECDVGLENNFLWSIDLVEYLVECVENFIVVFNGVLIWVRDSEYYCVGCYLGFSGFIIWIIGRVFCGYS